MEGLLLLRKLCFHLELLHALPSNSHAGNGSNAVNLGRETGGLTQELFCCIWLTTLTPMQAILSHRHQPLLLPPPSPPLVYTEPALPQQAAQALAFPP